MVATTTVVIVFPPLTSECDARRRKRKRKKPNRQRKAVSAKKQIREEGALTPKRDADLDDDISKTKSLKPAAEDDGPRIELPTDSKNEVENLLDSKLNEEIDLARKLTEFETRCDDLAPVRYRLAELYWEKSKRAFFKANDFTTPEDSRARYNAAMKQLQGRTVQNYQAIVDQCEGWDQFPKVLYNLGKTLVETGSAREGAQYFKRIIKEYPDNDEWVAQAWFMIGEYYFNEEGDARQAFRAYERAATYTSSSIYGFAVYKQGWCHINTGDWDLALRAFETVVTISDDPRQALDTKGRISLRKEALKDYVRSYSNIGDSKAAYRTFLRLGGKEDTPDMMERLGGWYINRDAHGDVITVYRDLIKHYRQSTRKPIFQGRIVNAADKQGDDNNTIKQVKLLTTYFKEVRDRLKQKRITEEQATTIRKDLAEAEDIAENTLRRLALERHKSAKKLPEGSRAQNRTYQVAYELYKHYLEVFPEPNPKATVNYVFFMRYYYAEVLFHMEKFLEAARNYDMVVDMNPNPTEERQKKIVLQAAEDAVRAYDELVTDMERKEGKPEVTGTDPMPIPPIKQDLINACQRYIKYVGSEGDKIVEIRYKMARIYYTYNHFDRAAPAFNDIVENHPEHEVACYAANLALDIHNLAKNYTRLRKLTRSYLRNNKLKASCEKNSSGEDFEKFAKIEADATFLLIKELEDNKKYVAAGNAYMDYYKQYGKGGTGPHAIDAIYNSAVNYDLGQRLDKANEVREFLVKTFARSNVKEENPLVLETMYNIAQSYERVVDFQKAAEYLEKFAAKYPQDKRTKDAIYNAGLYRSTLRDFDGGRAARQKYISLYNKEKDAHEVKFAICESLELEAQLLEDKRDSGATKKWTEAHDCYFDWIKDREYVSRSTDMLCHAQFRRGEIMRSKTKYTKGYVEQRKYLLKNWPSWKAKEGKDELPRCATAVSELLFRDLQDSYKKYADLRISALDPSKKEQFDRSIKAKVTTRDKLIEDYKKIAEIGVAEWALGSLYMIGEAYRNSINRVMQAPIPSKIPGYTLTEDDKAQLRAQLAEMAEPIKGLAVDAYSVCVDTAHRLGVYNKWSVKALERLQELRPEQYQPLVERLVQVEFKDNLKVASNGVVIRDGDGFKALDQALKDVAAAPNKGDAAGGGQGPGQKAPKPGAPAQKAPADDGVPAPVTSRAPSSAVEASGANNG